MDINHSKLLHKLENTMDDPILVKITTNFSKDGVNEVQITFIIVSQPDDWQSSYIWYDHGILNF